MLILDLLDALRNRTEILSYNGRCFEPNTIRISIMSVTAEPTRSVIRYINRVQDGILDVQRALMRRRDAVGGHAIKAHTVFGRSHIRIVGSDPI
jgi:hypothetical protein